MTAFYAQRFTLDNTAQLLVEAEPLDRAVVLRGLGTGALEAIVGFTETEVDSGHGFVIPLAQLSDNRMTVVLPACHELWIKGADPNIGNEAVSVLVAGVGTN